MTFMTRNCLPSSGLLRNGGTTWKVQSTSLKSGQTIRIYSISGLPRNSTGGRPDGLCICLDLTLHCFIDQVEVLANLMHCPGGQIMERERMTTRMLSCLSQNGSRFRHLSRDMFSCQALRDPS